MFELETLKDIVGIVGTIVGVAGFVFAIVKHFGEVRDKNVREWQKVIVQKLLQKYGGTELTFDRIKELYRTEAQAFEGEKLSKSDISEDSLRRVLVELVSTGIAAQGTGDHYSLKIGLTAPDIAADVQRKMFLDNDRLTQEAMKFLRVNKYTHTLPALTTHLSQETGIDGGRVELFLMGSVRTGAIIFNPEGKVALASEQFSPRHGPTP
jgi:hypothetical protein